MRTDRLKREFGVEFKWRVFPLHPEIPDEGMEISKLFAGREADIKAMQDRLLKIAAVEGLELSSHSHTYNTRMAQELGLWAESVGHGESFHKAVYLAYFKEGRNIGLIDELLLIAESVGLPAAEAKAVLSERSFSSAVDADWKLAGEMGITSVPSYICDGRLLAGFGSYENFLRLIGKG